jgi:Tfp pilus assembly protein PilZ
VNTLENESKESSVTARLFELIKGMTEEEQVTLLKDLEERLFKNKREHQRKAFFMVVDYSCGDRIYKDYIQNISAGGMFIETRMPFSVGHEVSLSFPIPNHQKYIRIAGEVVRICPQGIGVKFKTVNEDQEAMITSLLEII